MHADSFPFIGADNRARERALFHAQSDLLSFLHIGQKQE